MPSIVRARLSAVLCAILLVLTLQTRVSGQEPSLEVFYTRLDPKEQFKYAWKGKEGVCSAGVFRWEVPQTEFGTSGLDRNFTGYCAEVLVPITAEKLYRFRVNSLYEVRNYDGLSGKKEGAEPAAQRRAVLVRELFGRYFRDPVLKPSSPEEAVALQVALWEVIQETEPAEGELKLDLFAGDFRANYPRGEAPAFVRTAQGYLESLKGDDAVFYENPDLRGRELVRLMGVENADKVVAQSQFALRYAGGGGVGAGLPRALTTGAGLGPVGGFGGAPVAGAGTGGGNGGSGFLSTGTPGNGVTTTPPTNSPPTQPPIGTPPSGEPPEQPPETPTNPVPAPAGLLLGAIAVGALVTWRMGARVLAAK